MITLGIDRLHDDLPTVMKGRRVGLISNYTVVDGELVPTIDRLQADDRFRLAALFGPEHGVLNSARPGESVAFVTDAHSGLPAYSLYGQTRRPTAAMLEEIDVLVVDLQDIGSRYYTNMNTLALSMEAADEAGLPVVVLDRPNPLGGMVAEGYILEPSWTSFIGGGAMPNRHGLTMGELARWFHNVNGVGRQLTVAPMAGWRRDMLWRDTGLPFVGPSPNTTHEDMALLYAGTCLFEGTNLSLGRGTTHPFEVLGAPFLDGHRLAEAVNRRDLPGLRARPTYFVPEIDPWRGELCAGIQLHVRDPRRLEPVRAAVELLALCSTLYADTFAITPAHGKPSAFQRLAGTDRLERWLRDEGLGAADRYVDPQTTTWKGFREQARAAYLY